MVFNATVHSCRTHLFLPDCRINNAINLWSAVSAKDSLIPLAHFLLTAEGLQAKAALIVVLKQLYKSSDIEQGINRVAYF